MNDLQTLIPIRDNFFTIAKIYYIQTKYIFENGNEVVSDMDMYYADEQIAIDTMQDLIETAALPYGATSMEHTVKSKHITIKI